MRIFDINDEMADKMTLLTRGYPFAFQVLGYLYWDNRKDHTLEDIMPEYDQYLDEYVYSKIWAELSSKDKEILSVISESGYQSVKDIREKLDMKPELFSVYRDRLKRKGVIDTRQYGKIAMALPRFEEYVKTDYINNTLFPEFPRRNTIFFFEFSIKVRYIIKTTIRSHYNNRLGCGFNILAAIISR